MYAFLLNNLILSICLFTMRLYRPARVTNLISKPVAHCAGSCVMIVNLLSNKDGFLLLTHFGSMCVHLKMLMRLVLILAMRSNGPLANYRGC